jgi:threonyl-tRNA synthetase
MLTVTLPDGQQKEVANGATLYDVAKAISNSLAKKAIAGVIDGRLVDIYTPVTQHAVVRIITGQDPEGLEVIRHSSAHLLAQAVKRLYPQAQVTIGPVVEDGFYYDFALDTPFTPEDLDCIEKEMQGIVKENLSVKRQVMSREEAIALFDSLGERYKVDIIQAIPGNEELSVYKQGDFEDLCRGPHVPSTGFLSAFKLTKLAGAYWRGDSNNQMLQRVYGTAWADQKDLKQYLNRIEEAKRRDHRLMAKAMDLYHLNDLAPGMVFWHPNGWQVVLVIREYMREVQRRSGGQEVNTPQLVSDELWEKSGHKSKFGDEMFGVQTDSKNYAVKPMNCPCHVQIFNQGIRSYRDLPLRLTEFGSCTRNEPSGTLHGLLRLRSFVQDDGHTFCTKDQILSEVSIFIEQLRCVYRDFGFTDIIYRLSTRPEKRIGSDAVWDRAEGALSDALNANGVPWEILPGEGAFYGPKIEFSLRDCLGRVWQCGTMQVDFSMPERLEASYIAEDGSRQTPVMLHRAILGSFERFIAILLENTAGWLPVWLAPIQVVVLNITDSQADYASSLVEKLARLGLRARMDLRNEKIGYKIREHTLSKVPYLLVVGDREVEQNQVSVREAGSNDQVVQGVDEFIDNLQTTIADKRSVRARREDN